MEEISDMHYLKLKRDFLKNQLSSLEEKPFDEIPTERRNKLLQKMVNNGGTPMFEQWYYYEYLADLDTLEGWVEEVGTKALGYAKAH